ncbi:MAG: MFS transporter, partial [Desulfuromonadales bacterium]
PLGAIPTGRLRTYLLILLLFTLGNSSDAFLLLRAQHLGVASAAIPLLWTFFSLVKMLSVMPFGSLSDRLGRRGVIIAGWFVYALAYLGFGLAQTALQAWLLFGFYGLFYGLTEGVEKAFLVDLAQAGRVGGAFGWYNCAVGAGALPASLIFGFLWQSRGAATAFGFGAALAAVASILLLALVRPEGKIRESKK